MPQTALQIALSDEEREALTAWSRASAGEHRMVERSRVILLAAEGLSAREIARRLKTRLARVSKWRKRFRTERLEGLQDATRTGKPKTYDEKQRSGFWLCWTGIRPEATANGMAVYWPRPWAMSAMIRSGAYCVNTKSNSNGDGVGAFRRTLSSGRRLRMWWVCI